MKALITGGTGFLAGALAREGRRRGHGVVCVGRTEKPSSHIAEISYEVDDVARIVRTSGTDVLIHAAGSSSVSQSFTNPAADFAASVSLFQRVLEGVRLSGRTPRIVYVSSAAVYGSPSRLPIPESESLHPISPYGFHKVLCEQMTQEYFACFGIPVLVVRAFSLFGEAQRRLLIWELHRQLSETREVRLLGTGEEERDYLHISDFSALLWRCLDHVQKPYEVLNVASGRSVKTLELATMMGEIVGASRPVQCLGQRPPGDPMVWRADTSQMRALLGDQPQWSLRARLQQVMSAWQA